MLLTTHFQIFVEALKQNGYIYKDELLKLGDIQLNDDNIRQFSKGLFFPDLPCAYFYLDKGQLEMFIKLCSATKLVTLGKNTENTVSSQIEESHNGKFSINHSMATNDYDTNENVRLEIVRRCCIIGFKFLTTNDFTYLGYLTHIIQDSYSPGHTFRDFLDNDPPKTTYEYSELISNLKKLNKHEFNLTSNIDAKTVNNLAYVMLGDEQNIKLIIDEIDRLLNDNKTKEEVNYSRLFNILVKLIINTAGTEDPIIIKKILKIIIDDTNKKIINSIYIKKNMFKDKLLYDKIIINKYADIFQDGITYDRFPHNLTRLYKLVMNYLYSLYNLNKMEILKGGGSRYPYIKLFLYYPNQDSAVHGIKDCRGILEKDYGDKQLYNWAINDTANILTLMLSAKDVKEGVVNLYNHLMNTTYYIPPDYLKLVGKRDNPIVVDIYNKIELNQQNLNKTRKSFLLCANENIKLVAKQFNLGIKDVISIMNR
jgi:hypothetical protein